MVIILTIVAFVCFIATIMILSFMSKGSYKPQKTRFTDEQEKWLQKVDSIFSENKILSFLDVYVECGMPREIAYSKNHDAIQQAFPFSKEETKHDGYSVFTSYQLAIHKRHTLKYGTLTPIDETQYRLHLQKGEVILHRINGVVLHQEKTTRYNIAYSGIRWQSGMMRAGSMSFIGNEITRFTPMDIGRLFITNQRILFVGHQKNITKSIPVKSVLYYNLYQDGVLVNIPNRNPILFEFEIGYDADLGLVQDGLNEFIIVLDRVLAETETQNLE